MDRRSEKNLEGVKPQLVAVVRRALELTEVDFGITEGLRTKERQKQLVAEGKSQTMNSRHLTGDAVDAVAWVGSQVSWDWPLYEKISGISAGGERAEYPHRMGRGLADA